ncbi:Monothiol glutaredoxin-S2 [Camellia lanceoleosa]|uniref:Monothiol glutaredoxin-S2 n=1 Tax=Camellia lanceoleosa TaxID=1840588 RepID=A0ACC0FX73_9ERIC|nr:Monothiol glutaredoxin-S2 [Camellia lanceoleosa]
MATMSALGAEKPVVIFSKSGCCFGHTIKTLINSFGASPAVYELDELPYRRQLERELSSLRCRTSVPAVFIGGSWLAVLMSSSSSSSSSSYFDRGTVAVANLGFATEKWNLKRRVLRQWRLNSDGTTTDNGGKIKIEITRGRRGLTTMVLDVGLVEGRRTEKRWDVDVDVDVDVDCNGKMLWVLLELNSMRIFPWESRKKRYPNWINPTSMSTSPDAPRLGLP